MRSNISPIRRPARRNTGHVSHPDRNTAETERLRVALQMELRGGDHARISDLTTTSLFSVEHVLEGRTRFSADVVRAALLVLPTASKVAIVEELNEWLSGTEILVSLAPEPTLSTSLIPTTASASAACGRLAETVVLAAADGTIDQDEVDAIDRDADHLASIAAACKSQARRAAAGRRS